MKTRLTLSKAHELAVKKYGESVGVFGYLRTKKGAPISGKYISFGLQSLQRLQELHLLNKSCVSLNTYCPLHTAF